MRKVPTWLKNKYTIATLIFLLFILCIDNYNILYQYRLQKEYNKLLSTSHTLNQSILKAQNTNNELEKNPLFIEKIAREKYGMKKPGETVFLISNTK